MANSESRELAAMSKARLIAHFEAREARLSRNFQESFDNRLAAERARATEEGAISFPCSKDWESLGLFYFRPADAKESQYAVARREKLSVTHFQLGCMVFELPEELKIRDYAVVLLAFFNRKGEFCHWGMVSKYLNPIESFHSSPDHICLGDAQTQIQQSVCLDRPESIVEAFAKIRVVLSTVNPHSLWRSTTSLYPKPFVATQRHIMQRKYSWEAERAITHCAYCNLSREDCGCVVCEECGGVECDCAECEICSRVSCTCSYCDDCNMHWNAEFDSFCDCVFCPTCDLRRTSRHHDVCACARCGSCGRSGELCSCDEITIEERARVWRVPGQEQRNRGEAL